MSRRKVRLVLLCEDRQHEAFLRRFFEQMGWEKRQLEVRRSPKGRGAAEKWVRAEYPAQVKKLRSAPHVEAALVVSIDEDLRGPGTRERDLARELQAAGAPPIGATERVALGAPARNVETWLAYLGGADVDEVTEYPRLASERECGPMATGLAEMCRRRELRRPAPPSLECACAEFRSRLDR